MSVSFDEQVVGVRREAAACGGRCPTCRARPSWGDRARRVVEFGLAAVLLVLVAPVLALAALAVKLTSRGPVLYCQTRSGKGGGPYTIYKIRTMVHNCESATGARWSAPGDPRITAVGCFLRRSHLDELPQLWNVLRGDMSLVGPRPERPEFVVKLEQLLPEYGRRLSVLPGVTGLAQIQLPADTDLESVRRKLACDLYYIENRTLWLDARIILATAFKVFSIHFSVARTLLQIPGAAAVEDVKPAGEQQQVRAALAPPSFSSVT
jgi:lipopolysaccharide/colanic/teichoic acid biosynthesis glycosyltransferase